MRHLVWLLPCLCLLYWGSSTQYFTGQTNDDSLYLSAARSLASGAGFTDMHLPGHPPHQKYPIGYPLLLSGVERIWPHSLVAPRVLSAVLSLGCVALVLFLAGPWMALLTGANALWAQFASAVGTEPAYTLVLLAYLAVFSRQRSPVLLGLLDGAALYLRTAGIALVAAGALAGASLRERPARWIVPLLVAGLTLLPFYLSADRLEGYKEETLVRHPLANLNFYACLPLMLWGNPWTLRGWMQGGIWPVRLLILLGWGLLALGAWSLMRSGDRLGRLACALLGCGLGLHLVYHFLDFRYFLPLLPVLYGLLLSGARRLPGRWALPLVIGTCLAGNLACALADASQRPVHTAEATYGWISAHTSPTDILASEREDAWLYTGRSMVHLFPPESLGGEAWLAALYRAHVRWLVLTGVDDSYRDFLQFMGQRPDRFRQVFGNAQDRSLVLQLDGDGERFGRAFELYRAGARALDRGDWAGAAAQFRAALELEGDRDLGVARYGLAIALQKGGDREGARAELQKLLSVHPEHAPARALLQGL